MNETTAENQPSGGANGPAHGQLSLWDTVSIIVGIVIGTSIFTTPPTIFEGVAGPWEGLGLWLFCGILSLIGALCYAELATTYPRYGGDYVYLTRGFDRPLGFLFGWAQLAVILSASTGAMAFIFGEYSTRLLDMNAKPHQEALTKLLEVHSQAAKMGMPFPESVATQKQQLEIALQGRQREIALYGTQAAIGAVALLTALNFFGVVLGKWVQNVLVIVKLVGLALIVVAGLMAPADDPFSVLEPVRKGGGFPVAMILVLYAYGGWNDAAFVAADLKDRRNIPKALLLGTLGITVVYLLVNFAYILSLGFNEARNFRPTIAADVLTKAFGSVGDKFICIIVMTSALGAINGLIYTGSRVYLTLGNEHRVFGFLGYWNATFKSPIISLIAQALVSIAMILTVGTKIGRDTFNDILKHINVAIPWDQYYGGFNTLFAGSAPVFWIFFLLTGLSMFALRAHDPNITRPFMLKPPWYPILPMIFCGMCFFGFWSAMSYAGWVSLLGFIPLFLGLPLYWLSGKGPDAEAARPL